MTSKTLHRVKMRSTSLCMKKCHIALRSGASSKRVDETTPFPTSTFWFDEREDGKALVASRRGSESIGSEALDEGKRRKPSII